MTTATTTGPVHFSAVPGAVLSPMGIVRSEWTKLRSLRSTMWSLAVAVVLVIGLAAIASAATAHQFNELPPDAREHFDPTQISLAGALLAQLAIGVLGVLLISGEYSTGMIRSTMAAVPKRLPALWAKAAVYSVVTFLLMGASAVVAFLLGQRLLQSTGLSTTFGNAGVTRAVLGAPLYLTAVGLLGMGLGALLRHSAGAISAFVGIILLLPILENVLPRSWHVHKYLPGEAGQQILTVVHDPEALSPWAGYGLMLAYVAAVMAVAALLLKRRDV